MRVSFHCVVWAWLACGGMGVSHANSCAGGTTPLPHDQKTQRHRRYVGHIDIEGTTVFTPKQILRICTMKKRQITVDEGTTKCIERIRKAYLDRGYIRADVSLKAHSEQPADVENPVESITVRIYEGPRYHISLIEFIGNSNTRHRMVQRAAGHGLDVGEPYNPARIEGWVRGINRLGRFETVRRQDVEIEINEQGHYARVRIRLVEK